MAKNKATKTTDLENKIQIQHVDISLLKASAYNPRKWDEKAESHLIESLQKYGFLDPVIVNGAKNRKNILIGGHMRIHCAKKIGIKTVPVVYVNIPDIENI